MSTLQDFLDLGRNTLVDFLAVLAVELKLPTIESSEKQQAKLKKYYAGQLKKYSMCNPPSVEEAK